MLKVLLIGTMAVAAPQEAQQIPEARKPDVRSIEIEIPDIEIPSFDIYIPDFSFAVPAVSFHWDQAYDYELGVASFDISIPDIHIDVPEFRYDWGRDWDVHVQDMELDTMFEVNPSAVLGVRNHAGEIIIRTWDRNQMRVQASYSSDDRVKVFTSESSVKIRSETRHGHPDVVDYEITIPRTMGVDLWGFSTDVSVDGVQNDVRIETMSGDIEIRECAGTLAARSVEGDIRLIATSGNLEINGVEGDVTVVEFQGELHAESIDGDIALDNIRSANVEAKTVDGNVDYQGSISDDGRYRLTTHDGNVVVAIPANSNVTVSVATFDGEFEAEFPIRLDRAEGRRKFSFTLGNGSARLELHSFDGDIRLIQQ